MTSPGQTLCRALDWAAHLHADQHRKVSGAPYLAHLLGAAGIAAFVTDDEVAIAAALLHDAIEDQQATRAGAEAALGPDCVDEVWAVVEACTDVIDRTRFPEWRDRKRAYLKSLDRLSIHPDPVFVRRVATVALADKLYNARSIETELRAEGAAAFDRMAGGTEAMTWYLPNLAERLHRLARTTGSRPLIRLAADYRSTVSRIATVYNLLNDLPEGIRIGRAADLAMGWRNLRIVDRSGRGYRVDITVEPERVPRAVGSYPTFRPSRAAAEREVFADAVSGAVRWVVDSGSLRPGPTFGRLGYSFSAAAAALEHGASTSETCAALLVGLPQPATARGEAAFAEQLGARTGAETFAILRGCALLAPRRGRVAPRFAARLPRTGPHRTRRRSVFTVLAADVLTRASALEGRLRRIPVNEALVHPPGEVARLQTVAALGLHEFGGSLATELTDVWARVQAYFAAAEQLTEPILDSVARAEGPVQIVGVNGGPLRTLEGGRYRMNIAVRADERLGRALVR